MRTALVRLGAAVRTQLWPFPVLGILAALVAGVLLPQLDHVVDDQLPSAVRAMLFGGDASAARTLLDAIASSLITVTSLTFSLTVVTLQLASSQFSPRLLRTFTSDVFVQSTLMVFLATFTYALTVLRSVRTADGGNAGSVPRLSVTVGFALAVVSVIGLVLFLAHLAREIRVETMLRDVHDAASATLLACTRKLASGPADGAGHLELPAPATTAVTLRAPSSGFLNKIDESRLLRAATKYDAYVELDCYAGSSLIEGVPVGRAWRVGIELPTSEADRIRTAVARTLRVGYERTATHDIGFGLRQLTDVANKALSPGINDPTTAIHALGHVSALLCQMASRDVGPVVLRDDDDRARVTLARPTLAEHVEHAITQPRRYGSQDPLVVTRLLALLEELAQHVTDEAIIREQLGRLQRTIERGDFDDVEREQFDAMTQRVADSLSHRVPLAASDESASR